MIRDGIFIQRGPPTISDGRYLAVVIIGCIAAALFRIILLCLQTAFCLPTRLGWVVTRSLVLSMLNDLPILTAIMIGIAAAAGCCAMCW